MFITKQNKMDQNAMTQPLYNLMPSEMRILRYGEKMYNCVKYGTSNLVSTSFLCME